MHVCKATALHCVGVAQSKALNQQSLVIVLAGRLIITKGTTDNGQNWIFCPNCGSRNRPERISCFNCETSLPRNKGKRPWYESPFWGPLTIAVIGSIIILIGQFASIVLPIYLGPDVSDYNIICTPSYFEITSTSPKNVEPINCTISIISLHPLQKYTRQVYLAVINPPGFSTFSHPCNQALYAGQSTNMRFVANKSSLNSGGSYPIVIQAAGADGKRRNCTIIAHFTIS